MIYRGVHLILLLRRDRLIFVNCLLDSGFLTESEIDIVRRGRNMKTHKSPKNCDAVTYKYSTGFEVLIGYLYVNNKGRLYEVFNYIVSLEGSS